MFGAQQGVDSGDKTIDLRGITWRSGNIQSDGIDVPAIIRTIAQYLPELVEALPGEQIGEAAANGSAKRTVG